MHVVIVGFIEHDENARRDRPQEAVQLFGGKHRPRGIIRITEIDDLGALSQGALDRYQVAGVFAHGRRRQTRAHLFDGDAIDVK